MKVVWIVAVLAGLITLPLANIVIEQMQSDGTVKEGNMDKVPPVSSIFSPRIYLIPEGGIQVIAVPTIQLIWQGADDPVEGFIDHFDVQYRVWDMNTYSIPEDQIPYFGEWTDLYTNTTERSARFAVEVDHTYSFRVRAVDTSGNTEDWPQGDDCKTYVFGIPGYIYDKVLKAIDHVSEIGESLPRNTTPISRVLPNELIHFANCYNEEVSGDIILYPEIEMGPEIFSNAYCQGIYVEWKGIDPVGRGELTYDVQYMRTYLDDEGCYVPEAYPHPPLIPVNTGWIDWILNTNKTSSFLWPGEPGLYMFRCRAQDSEGNLEAYPVNPDAYTYVLPLI